MRYPAVFKAVDVLSPYVAFATAKRPLIGAELTSMLEKVFPQCSRKVEPHISGKIPYPKEDVNTGNLYTVELLPDADEFLDWDRPLSEQSEKVKAAIASAEWDGPKDRYENGKFIGDVENALAYSKRRGEAMNGADLYAVIVSALRPKAGAGIAEMQKHLRNSPLSASPAFAISTKAAVALAMERETL